MPDENHDTGCGLCGARLGEARVVQVVEDRHPTYDRELVLETCHRECWNGREEQVHTCTACGCRFRLALIERGAGHQNLSGRLICPFCSEPFASSMGLG